VSEDEAVKWARALYLLLRTQKSEARIPAIVEAIKSPLAAGAATDALLDTLHDADPKAPGSRAGLEANLAWLTASYPQIAQSAPPRCPIDMAADPNRQRVLVVRPQ